MTPGPKVTKRYSFNGLSGCVTQRRSRMTGHLIGLYNAEQARMDPESGPWATVCEPHGTCTNHPSRKIAESWLGDPVVWCEDCQKEQEGKSNVDVM